MQELADFLGVSLSAVSKIEKGYRRIDQEQLVRIAEFLDCPRNPKCTGFPLNRFIFTKSALLIR